MRRLSNLLATLICVKAFSQSPTPVVEAVFVASTNSAFSNSWTFRVPLSITNSMAFTNFPLEGAQYLKIRSISPPTAAPPTPTIDTNLAEVGSVNLVCNPVNLAISLTFVTQPITNVVVVSLLSSTNATAWTYAQTLFTPTNPPNTFYKLAITNQTQ